MEEKMERVCKFQKELRIKATKAEIEFESILKELDINYIFQKGFIKGDLTCIVDFYIPKPYKICIEIDGGYHNDEYQIKKDEYREKYLSEFRRFTIIRFTNEEVFNNRDEIKSKIIETMEKCKSRNDNITKLFRINFNN